MTAACHLTRDSRHPSKDRSRPLWSVSRLQAPWRGPIIAAYNMTSPHCCWCCTRLWHSSSNQAQTFAQTSVSSRVILVSTVNITQLMSNIMYVLNHWSLIILWGGSFRVSCTEAMDPGIWFQLIFSNGFACLFIFPTKLPVNIILKS